MRIVIIQFLYETNTFNLECTEIGLFKEAGCWLEGESAVRAWVSKADSQTKGSLEVLEGDGFEAVPVFAAIGGACGGRLSSACYREIRSTIRNQVAAALPADVVIAHLHGAVCAENEDDVEGDLLEMLREEVGFGGRLILSLDLHANVTRRMLEHADAVTAYRTSPHKDTVETGRRAAQLAVRDTGYKRAAFRLKALLAPNDATHISGHFAEILAYARSQESQNRFADISLFPVQPWLDVEELGSSVVVSAFPGQEAESVAREISARWWKLRREWKTGLRPWEEILPLLKTPTDKPWFLVDTADTTTGGSNGRSAEALRRLLPIADQLSGDVLLWVVDPGSVDDAKSGKSRFRLGEPSVEWSAEAAYLGDVDYRARGGAYTGQEFTMGQVALLRSGRIQLVVTSQPAFVADPAFYEAVGLDPYRALAVQVKSFLLWIAGYGVDPDRGLYFDGPGCTSLNFKSLPFSDKNRDLFPICENLDDPVCPLWIEP